MSPQSIRRAIGHLLTEFMFAFTMLLFVILTGVAASGIAAEARLERLATMNGHASVALIGATDAGESVKP
jgi:hypothetical protein